MERWLLYLLFCLAGFVPPVHARNFVSNLDVVAGLPSNHIYGMLVDRKGYLWVATPEGVARYNGYDVRVFDVSDGLPTNDVWELFEDKKGRIWLLSFSQSLGYIYNDRYKAAFILDSSLRIIPAPHTIRSYNDGVFLYNSFPSYEHSGMLLVEHNDTFQSYRNYMKGYQRQLYRPGDTGLLPRLNGYLPYGTWQHWFYGDPFGLIKVALGSTYDDFWRFNNYILFYSAESRRIIAYDLRQNGFLQIVPDKPGSDVKIVPGARNTLYLLMDSVLYQFDDTLGLIPKWQPEKADFMPGSLLWIAEGAPWGICLGTAGKGVYIVWERKEVFQTVTGELSGYQKSGCALNGKHYWYNMRLMQLAVFNSATGHLYYRKFPQKVKRIIPWNNRYSLLVVNMAGIYMLDNETEAVRDFLTVSELDGFLKDGNVSISDVFRLDDLLMADSGELYLLSRLYGLSVLQMKEKRLDLVMWQNGFSGLGAAYKGLVRDPARHTIWAYGNAEAVMYNPEGKEQITIRNPFLHGIDEVLIDSVYGNVFVKKMDDLFMLDRRTGIITRIGEHISMNKSYACLQGDLLILGGRFGAAFFRILGPARLAGPIVFENLKDEYYSSLSDIQTADSILLMNTNRGLLKCPIPDSSSFLKYTQHLRDMRLIVKDHLGLRAVSSGDTVFLDPRKLNLQFDVIDPAGNGTLEYSYHFPETDDDWQKSGSNDLAIPLLKPDHYYTLLVQTGDYVQRHYFRLNVYVVPQWWQTIWMKRMVVLAGLLALFLLAWLTAWITRRIVRKENLKKNLRMEIELKSIYAQINPHFIYNTLNTVMALIRTGNTQDAFYSVSKFSKLLRAYIRSSRNRYITVGEEMENLKNYIELQQVRFNGKFNYRIRVEDPENELPDMKIPSLLLQPIVENAINHGLFHKEGAAGNLNILFAKGENAREIICIIEDDGIGREKSGLINQTSTVKSESYGSLLIEDLIGILNRYEQADIRIAYTDKQAPQTGTVVKLYIK